MMKILVLLFAFCGVCISVNYIPKEVKIKHEFVRFMAKYGKQYDTQEEYEKRFAIFQESLQKVDAKNAKARAQGYDTKFGVTKFSDLTQEEFKRMYLTRRSTEAVVDAPVFVGPFSTPLPTSFDWRDKGAVTPVKDQGQCGSCWAFSTTEGTESAWFLAGHKLPVLAPQQIVDCDDKDDGCDGGDLPTAFDYVKKNGLESESAYPYTAEDGTCNYDKSDVVAHITGFQYATKTQNETEMQYAMIAHGPLSVCVEADTWQYYEGGILKNDCGTELDHCVQAVGFNSNANNVPYWIVRNSWGSDWGLDGYIWIERNKDLCGIAIEATYATA